MAERVHWLGNDSAEQDSRLGVGALFTPLSGVAVVSGVLTGLQVAQTGAASANVLVPAGRAVIQASSAVGGAYLETLDSAKTVDVIGGDRPPESSPRNDLVVYHAGAAEKVYTVHGVANAIPVDPAVPAQAIALARVRVKAASAYVGTPAVVNADVDDLRVFTAPLGARVPVASAAARNVLAPSPGDRVWRLDRDREETYVGGVWCPTGGVMPASIWSRTAVTSVASGGDYLLGPSGAAERSVGTDVLSVSGGIWTAAVPGMYRAKCRVTAGAGAGNRSLRLVKNNVTNVERHLVSGDQSNLVDTELALDAGDNLRFIYVQETGGSLALVSGNADYNRFEVSYLGPK